MLPRMKKPLATFVSLFALSLAAACGGGSSAAVGTYQLDKAALKQSALGAMTAEQKKEMEALPADQRKAAEETMSKMFDGMDTTIDLKADGSAAVTMKGEVMGMKVDESATGTWKLEGSKLTLVTKDKTGPEETKTADYANGSFSFEEAMGGGPKMKMTFKKK